MKKTRYTYLVSVNRDDVPGWNHQPGDMKEHLIDRLPEWYEPEVKYLGSLEVYEPSPEDLLEPDHTPEDEADLWGVPDYTKDPEEDD